MFTAQIREKLRVSYGIRDVPQELLLWLVRKHTQKTYRGDAATVAFLVACDWQRGLSTEACK